LAEEKFGIPLTSVKEGIGMIDITPIPNMPPFFKGIINLRGRIISVIDLKAKLSIQKRGEDSKRPCIVICEFGEIVLGSVVDDVLEVRGYEESNIEHNMDLHDTVARDFIIGIAKSEGKGLTILIDIGKALRVDELEAIRAANNATKAA
jgi:purine-binding chemotaxis protein CheW